MIMVTTTASHMTRSVGARAVVIVLHGVWTATASFSTARAADVAFSSTASASPATATTTAVAWSPVKQHHQREGKIILGKIIQ